MRKGMVYGILLVGATLMFGCATMKNGGIEDVPATKDDYNRFSTTLGERLGKIEGGFTKFETAVNKLIEALEKKTVTAEGPKKEEVPAVPTKTDEPKKEEAVAASAKEELKKVEVNAPEAISDLQKRIEVLETQTTETQKEVGALKEKVAGIKIRVVRVNKQAGATFEFAGGQRYFLIGPFKTGSAEVKGLIASQLKRLTGLIEKEGLTAAIFIGFTDETPFRSAKNPADNEVKNLELAKNRAETTLKALGKLGEGAKVLARGTTEQFGSLDANRCVMVVIAKKATAPAAPAPATPPTPPVASPPTK